MPLPDGGRAAQQRCAVTVERAPVVEALDTDGVLRLSRSLPRPLVFTNGVFDLLHAGHADALIGARALGAALVVGVNTDASARRLHKGPGRPIVQQADRAALVAALASVDAVVLFDDDAPLALIDQLRPQVYVKGDDRSLADLPEAEWLAAWGGRVVLAPRTRGLSSSVLVQRVLDAGTP